MGKQRTLKFTIENVRKLSFNSYSNMHWATKKKFKDSIRSLTLYHTDGMQLKGGYSLNFKFYFEGRKLDTINVFHYCKIIEDVLFANDNKNKRICVEVFKLAKGDFTNRVELILTKK